MTLIGARACAAQVIKRSTLKRQAKRSTVKVRDLWQHGTSTCILGIAWYVGSMDHLTMRNTFLHTCMMTLTSKLSLQTFIKTVNYNHIMPTRYTLDVDFKASVSNDVLQNSTKKVEVQKVRGLAWWECDRPCHSFVGW